MNSKKHKKFKKEERYCNCKDNKIIRGCGGCFYFLGFLGATGYYIQTAFGFWAGVLGVLKALVWPVFLIFEVLKFLGA